MKRWLVSFGIVVNLVWQSGAFAQSFSLVRAETRDWLDSPVTDTNNIGPINTSCSSFAYPVVDPNPSACSSGRYTSTASVGDLKVTADTIVRRPSEGAATQVTSAGYAAANFTDDVVIVGTPGGAASFTARLVMDSFNVVTGVPGNAYDLFSVEASLLFFNAFVLTGLRDDVSVWGDRTVYGEPPPISLDVSFGFDNDGFARGSVTQAITASSQAAAVSYYPYGELGRSAQLHWRWAGIENYRIDGVLTPVSLMDIRSASGFDYRYGVSPVPTVSPLGAMIAGLVFLFGVRNLSSSGLRAKKIATV